MAASRGRRNKSTSSRSSSARGSTPRSSRNRATPARPSSAQQRNGKDQGSDLARIVAMLMDDHAKIDKLAKKFEKLKKAEDDSRYEIVQDVCQALTVHTTIEEECFYPAARNATGEGKEEEDMLDEAEVEHTHIKELVADLKDMNEDDPLCDAKFKVLSEYVRHHVKEEENELFPRLKKLKEGFEGVYQQMLDLREQMESGAGAYIPGKGPSEATLAQTRT